MNHKSRASHFHFLTAILFIRAVDTILFTITIPSQNYSQLNRFKKESSHFVCAFVLTSHFLDHNGNSMECSVQIYIGIHWIHKLVLEKLNWNLWINGISMKHFRRIVNTYSYSYVLHPNCPDNLSQTKTTYLELKPESLKSTKITHHHHHRRAMILVCNVDCCT